MAGSAGITVKDGAHSGLASLTNDFCGKIDLVMWRADARGDLHYQVARIAAKLLLHGRNRLIDDAKLRALFTRVNEPNRAGFLVGKINSRTVGNIDGKAKPRAKVISPSAPAAGSGESASTRATPLPWTCSARTNGIPENPSASAVCLCANQSRVSAVSRSVTTSIPGQR